MNGANLFFMLFLATLCFAGVKLNLLTISGGIAAFFVGILTFAGLGLKGLALLLAFFLSSSFWSAYKKKAKKEAERKLAKGSRRDWQQVLANGGAASLFAFASSFSADMYWPIAFSIFLASSNSDTWASEIGTASRSLPVNIRTMKRTSRGTSGAISGIGTLAAIGGSLFIAFSAAVLFHFNWEIALVIFFFGFIGCLLDTVLGAFVQASYKCANCGMATEKTFHCGRKTVLVRGYSVLNNEMVNFLSSLIAVLFWSGLYFSFK